MIENGSKEGLGYQRTKRDIERERERQAETEKETETETERKRKRETDRQREREKERAHRRDRKHCLVFLPPLATTCVSNLFHPLLIGHMSRDTNNCGDHRLDEWRANDSLWRS